MPKPPAVATADDRVMIDRRAFLGAVTASTLSMALGPRVARAANAAQATRKPNVLFIAVDDLRPQLGCYGHTETKSPAIDRLATRGTLFRRAYCNVPVCGPSRLCVLTGLRAEPNQWGTGSMKRDFVSLPAHFKDHGYHTVSNGKIFHHMRDRQDDWSEAPWRSEEIYHGDEDWAKYNTYGQWQNEESAEHINEKTGRGPYAEAADVPDNAYQDGKVADKTIEDLKRLKGQDKPFFLACGFWRPHLPFNAPRKYWDLYNRDEIEIADNRSAPEDLPPTVKQSSEIDSYSRAGDRKSTLEFHREARHAYYACVSYVDAQIGRVVAALDELGLADNTIIVLWGDHGWNLGEHNLWGKHNTLHDTLHSPLIVCAPGHAAGHTTERLVELIDIYPSLCELAGVPVPEHVEATSVAPLLKQPDRPWKSAAFSKWNGCEAVKTDRYLFTEWRKDDRVTHRMLFDHQVDPDENVNIAGRPENAEIVEQLSQILRDGWRAARPAV